MEMRTSMIIKDNLVTEHHSAAPVAESSEAEVGEDDVEEEEDAERHNHQDPGETLLKR